MACAGDIDRAGLEQRDHALELVEILATSANRPARSTPRARRHAWRRQREQRMIDAVVGQDHQRPLGAHVLRRDPAPQRAAPASAHRCRYRAPRRIDVGAIAEKNPVRRLPRPMLEPVADAARAVAQAASVDFRMMLPSALRSAVIEGVANSVSARSRLVAAASVIGFLHCSRWSRPFALRENRAARQCCHHATEDSWHARDIPAQTLSKRSSLGSTMEACGISRWRH